MKSIVLGVLVLALAVGCARPPAPKAGTALAVSSDTCNQVYNRWLVIGAITGYGAHPDVPEEMKAGQEMLDEALTQNGTAAKFFHSCLTTMNDVQAACMLRANTLDELHTCAAMYQNKN